MIITQAGGVNGKQDRAGGEKGRDEEKKERERERLETNGDLCKDGFVYQQMFSLSTPALE